MAHTLEVPGVPDEIYRKLDERLRETGQDRTDYMIALLRRDLQAPTLSEILAPFRSQVAASGVSDEELEQLFQDARDEVQNANGMGRSIDLCLR